VHVLPVALALLAREVRRADGHFEELEAAVDGCPGRWYTRCSVSTRMTVRSRSRNSSSSGTTSSSKLGSANRAWTASIESSQIDLGGTVEDRLYAGQERAPLGHGVALHVR
jgi:hypothetical protein